jgi:hypothetical protein
MEVRESCEWLWNTSGGSLIYSGAHLDPHNFEWH